MCLVFDIKRYAIHDGPGIRTTIFLKGCPLSCVWCHNPEGISAKKQQMYTRKKCIGCATCVDHCPRQALTLTPDGVLTHQAACDLCGLCAAVCPTKAMELSGKEYTVDQLMHEIEKEMLFMDKSGGGVTFSGGEPLMHPKMLLELIARCKSLGIHCAVDTTLYARAEVVREVMKGADLFLVDLKLMDSSQHRLYCGVPNERILSNIQLIAEAGQDFIVRMPLIEGVNADDEHIGKSVRFLASLPWRKKQVDLLPYHEIAKGKQAKLGTVYNPTHLPMHPPTEEKLQAIAALFRQNGIEVLIGG